MRELGQEPELFLQLGEELLPARARDAGLPLSPGRWGAVGLGAELPTAAAAFIFPLFRLEKTSREKKQLGARGPAAWRVPAGGPARLYKITGL